jgi:uncharacterized protein DUF2569
MNPEPLSESTPKENAGIKQLPKLSKEPEPPKIRGLLILVACSLIFSLLQNLSHFLASIAPIINSPQWERFTNPGSPMFHPQWKLVLICGATTAALILFWNVVTLVLFFRKKRVFPVLAAASLPIIFLLVLGGHYLEGIIPAVAESAVYAKEGTTLIWHFIRLHIWIPYFLLSKRVAKTFVR